MAIGTNPGGGTLSGTNPVAAVSGVATFANLSIDKAGNGYTLTASAGGPDQRDEQRLQHHRRRGHEAGLHGPADATRRRRPASPRPFR